MTSIIDKAFTEAYNEAAELYDKNELEKCIEKANELLDDGAAPRYHRMKTWILLGNVLGDWEEANDCFIKAESLWRIVRRWHPIGEDTRIDSALQELRDSLDELRKALDDDRPAENDPDQAIDKTISAHDVAVEQDKALARAENDDPEELNKVEEGIRKAALRPKIKTVPDQSPDPRKAVSSVSGPAAPNALYVPPHRRVDANVPGGGEAKTDEIRRPPHDQ